jgi:hypothetical protein
VTASLRLTVLVDTEFPSTDLRGTPLLSKERGADRLAAALAELGHDAAAVEAPLAAAPVGWVLYFGVDPEEALRRCGSRQHAVRHRMAIMDQDRVTAGELIRELNVPLVVTTRSYGNWLRDSRTAVQIVAKPALARSLDIPLPVEEMVEPFLQFTVPGLPLPAGIVRSCVAGECSR